MELSQKEKATLCIGWTTFPDKELAYQFAHEIIAQGLAVCVQLEDPIISLYKWEDKIESATECRLMIKFLKCEREHLESYLHQKHPYDTPEWLFVDAVHVAEKYKQWVFKTTKEANPTLT